MYGLKSDVSLDLPSKYYSLEGYGFFYRLSFSIRYEISFFSPEGEQIGVWRIGGEIGVVGEGDRRRRFATMGVTAGVQSEITDMADFQL